MCKNSKEIINIFRKHGFDNMSNAKTNVFFLLCFTLLRRIVFEDPFHFHLYHHHQNCLVFQDEDLEKHHQSQD